VSGYRFIKQEIMQRIRERVYAQGDIIPNEVELAAEFGCSRTTVNRAMQELADDGIIDRRRKGGSRVRMAPVRQTKLEIPLIRMEIEATGATYRYLLIERAAGNGPPWLLQCLKLTGQAPVIHLRCVHFADETPQIYEERWISLAAVPQAANADFSIHNPNEWLVSAVPFTTAEFAFSAINLNTANAKLLNAKAGDASFVAERTTWLDGTSVTFARLMFRPGYQMVTRI
jgi:GntR family transcriptional regulator, histidine utilization repressor